MEVGDECRFMDVSVFDQSLVKLHTPMNKSNSEKDFNLFIESLSKSNSTSTPSIVISPALNNSMTTSSLLESPTSSIFAHDQNDKVMMEQIKSPTSSTFANDQNVVSLLKAKLNDQESADAFIYFEKRGLTTRKQDDLHDDILDLSKTKYILNLQGPTSDGVANLVPFEAHVMPKESQIQAICESDSEIINKHDFEEVNQQRRKKNAESAKRCITKNKTKEQQLNDDVLAQQEKRRMNRDAAKRYRMRQKAKNQQTQSELDRVKKQNAALSSQNILLRHLVNDALVRQEKLKDEHMENEMPALNQSTPQNDMQFTGGLTDAFMPNINQFPCQGPNFPCLPSSLRPMFNNYFYNNINRAYPTTGDDDEASTSNTQNNYWM